MNKPKQINWLIAILMVVINILSACPIAGTRFSAWIFCALLLQWSLLYFTAEGNMRSLSFFALTMLCAEAIYLGILTDSATPLIITRVFFSVLGSIFILFSLAGATPIKIELGGNTANALSVILLNIIYAVAYFLFIVTHNGYSWKPFFNEWADQGAYEIMARCMNNLDFFRSGTGFLRGPGYPILAAPFTSLLTSNPFLPINLIYNRACP